MHPFPNIEIFIGITQSCSQKTRHKVAFICNYLTANNPELSSKVTSINVQDKTFIDGMWYIISEREKNIYVTDITDELSVKLRDSRKIELALYGLIAPFFFENLAGPSPLPFIENSNVISSYMFHYNSLACLQNSLSTIKTNNFCAMSCSIELPINTYNVESLNEGLDAVKMSFKPDDGMSKLCETFEVESFCEFAKLTKDIPYSEYWPATTYCSPSGLKCERQRSPRLILTFISRA